MPGPYSVGCFDDQFYSVGGDHTSYEYSLSVPFDCVLQRMSAIARSASSTDAYMTLLLNGDVIVSQGDGLKMDTTIDFIVLANIPAKKGDKLTVRLNLILSNTIQKGKTVIAYAAPVDRDVVAPGYYPTYAYG